MKVMTLDCFVDRRRILNRNDLRQVYSPRVKKAAVEAYLNGTSIDKIAQQLGCKRKQVYVYMHRWNGLVQEDFRIFRRVRVG